MRSSHNPNRLDTMFDDDRLVVDAVLGELRRGLPAAG